MNLNSKKKQESIKAFLRVKPISPEEDTFLEIVSPNTVLVKGQEEYNFDKIFGPSASNDQVFASVGDSLISHSLQGFNSCVLAYGQTSSGKTYTMKGSPGNEGIISLTIRKLFSNIESSNLAAEVRISYIEIYNENIIDLLNKPENNCLEIREDYKKNITIIGLSQIKVESVQAAMAIFEQGEAKRKFGSNKLNEFSSRSHTIFRITIQVAHQDFSHSVGCINMVDLAGSEGVSRTKAEGSTKKEGENINKSILALSNVIRGMSEKLSYVNFRDSKLTRILQSSLCSNSRSFVVCTISPTMPNLQESINTMKFGVEASNIQLSLKQNLNTNRKKFEKQASSEIEFENDGSLLARERVEYQENKRLINELREENRELRELKRKTEEKVEFLELDNHRQEKYLKSLEEELQRNKASRTERALNPEEREIYEGQISSLKSSMNMIADKYEALNEYNCKIQKNERFLLARISKYENQIEQLKESVQAGNSREITPAKKRQAVKAPEHQTEYCPLTIGSIVLLRTEIIKLRQQLCKSHEQLANATQEIMALKERVEEPKSEGDSGRRPSGKINPSHQEGRQIKALVLKIRRMKKQISHQKIRVKKLIELLKASCQRGIEEYDQFNEWLARKRNCPESAKKIVLPPKYSHATDDEEL